MSLLLFGKYTRGEKSKECLNASYAYGRQRGRGGISLSEDENVSDLRLKNLFILFLLRSIMGTSRILTLV